MGGKILPAPESGSSDDGTSFTHPPRKASVHFADAGNAGFIEDNQADELAKQFALMLKEAENDSDSDSDGRATERDEKNNGLEAKTLQEETKDWEVRSVGSSSSNQSSHSRTSSASATTAATSASSFSNAIKGETAQDIRMAKGGTDEEIGTHTYDHVTQNKIRESHQRFWHKPLKNVDKMLFSTDCSETPMIINTILLLDGVINITQLRIFLRKLADLHPRMRMCIVNGKWEPAKLDFDVIVRYHKVPDKMALDHYVEKKKLLSDSIDTTEHLWEWHVFMTAEGKHAFLVRIHHVIGDGLSLVKMVVHSFDHEGENSVISELTSTQNTRKKKGKGRISRSKKKLQEDCEAAKIDGNVSEDGSEHGSDVSSEVGSEKSDKSDKSSKSNKSDKSSKSNKSDKSSKSNKSNKSSKSNNSDTSNSEKAPAPAQRRKKRKPLVFTIVVGILQFIAILVSFVPVIISIFLMRSDKKNVFRSNRRHISKAMHWIRLCSVDEVKALGKSCRGSINDVMCAILAGAMRSYSLRVAPELKVPEMSVVIPISTRSMNEKGINLNNQVASVFLKLPTAEKNIKSRYKKTKSRMDWLKVGPNLPVMILLIKFVLSILPAGLLKRIQESYISKTTMIFSNVPGPREKMYLQGIKIQDLFGFVPLVGDQQCGFVCFSYGGDMMMSILCNKKTMKSPKLFTECYTEEYRKFCDWCNGIEQKKHRDSVHQDGSLGLTNTDEDGYFKDEEMAAIEEGDEEEEAGEGGDDANV